MKKKLLITGIISLALIFGFVSCDNGSMPDDYIGGAPHDVNNVDSFDGIEGVITEEPWSDIKGFDGGTVLADTWTWTNPDPDGDDIIITIGAGGADSDITVGSDKIAEFTALSEKGVLGIKLGGVIILKIGYEIDDTGAKPVLSFDSATLKWNPAAGLDDDDKDEWAPMFDLEYIGA